MKNAANQHQQSNASPVHQNETKGNESAPHPSETTTTTSQAPVPSSNESGGGNVKMKLPHARAIYDFNSKESGDLNFKKTDIILLKKKIDQNWYIGELNNRTGSFPINHVQVSVGISHLLNFY